MEKIPNPQIDLANKFIQLTHKNIFLTGKAGTGKTTFLQNLKLQSVKRMAVIAPTGVAAINAGGMTIHSFFQLPFGPIVPGKRDQDLRKRRFSRKKIQMIKCLDLLVIDEISMVRADVLDAIDAVLRRYRDYRKPFGGVQLLMVGDLHQLPPVVRPEEWNLLRDYYQTMYFFGSLALQKTDPITIELKHIYRQSDQTFIHLLNKVRNNQLDQEVLKLLNSRYDPDFQATEQDGYITLTSHNASAYTINMEKLEALQGKSYRYRAEIEGSFPEKAYPTEELLHFKIGAQVMFIKNDSSPEKRYYNGKIGKISKIEQGTIIVSCIDDQLDIPVRPQEWHNIKYSLNEKTKVLNEEVLGTFRQVPLKTAWAITIHKSQGLTFEKAIIDAEAAFAHGQVYVALSRCKSFEGIVLRSPIGNASVRTDQVVQKYSEEADRNAPDEQQLYQSKKQYQQNLIYELFDFSLLQNAFDQLIRVLLEKENSIQGDPASALKALIELTENKIFTIARKFTPQLNYYFQQENLPEEQEELQERIKKAGSYFSNHLKEELLPAARNILILSDNQSVKTIAKEKLENLQRILFNKMRCFEISITGFNAQNYIQTLANAEIDFKNNTKTLPKPKIKITLEDHPDLYEILSEWRAEKAEELALKRFQILPNKAIIAITQVLPTEGAVLKKIHGLGPKRIQKYGADILQLVLEYIEKNKIDQNDCNKI